MTVYTRPRALAQRLLAKYGAAVTLTRTTPGGYDPTTGTVTDATVTTYAGLAFREDYALKDIDGTLVQRGDVKLLIAPKATDGTDMPRPQPATDVAQFDGTTYRVIACDPLSPAGENVMFTAQARV